MAAQPALMVLQGIDYGYGKEDCLRQVETELPEGKITCLLGAAGCGKTTLLKLLAGQIRPRSGRLMMEEKSVRRIKERQCGAVFSHTRLNESLKIGLQLKGRLLLWGIRGNEAEKRMAQALQMMEMQGCESRYPDQLSDGEYGRVLLARALMQQPRLLILDEPFRGLDQAFRQRLWQRLGEWQKAQQATIIFSSAQPEDAINYAHHALLMRAGRILQADAPHRLVQSPQSHYAATFLRPGNILRGVVTGLGRDKAAVEMDGITLHCIPHQPVMLGDQVALWVDYGDVCYGLRPKGRVFLSGVLREYRYGPGGRMAVMELLDGLQIIAYCHQGDDCAPGGRVFIWWDVEKAMLVPWDPTVEA